MSDPAGSPLAHRYRPRSYRELETYLGASDATVEWLEVAVRHLAREHSLGGASRLEQLATDLGVKVNAIPVERLAARTRSLELLAIAPYVEVFLAEFRREHPRVIRTRTSDEDLLSYTLDAFDISRHSVGEFEYEVVQYYRRARNHLMHRIKSAQQQEELTIAAELRARRPERYVRLDAPNPLEQLLFDDFLLFTRALKSLGQALCNAAAPSTQELISAVAVNTRFVSSLRDRSQNPERIRRRLASYLRTEYGYGTVADAIAADMIANGLLAQR
jgi:hypothetical protein